MMDSTSETYQAGKANVTRSGTVSDLVKGVGNPDIKKIKLKYNEAFIVTNVCGDFLQSEREMGLYWRATRYLRTCNLFLASLPLMPLSHSISDKGDSCQIDLTNPQLSIEGTTVEPNIIHVRRYLELQNQQLIQTIEVHIFHLIPLKLELRLELDADFYDIFEVREWPRAQRGIIHPPRKGKDAVTFAYSGLDTIERETTLKLTPSASRVSNQDLYWDVELRKDQPVKIQLITTMSEHSKQHFVEPIEAVSKYAALPYQLLHERPLPEVHTDDTRFDQLLKRGLDDLLMMCSITPQGIYPYGGIPSYVCPFGRDGLITSLEFLPWYPEVARGTLSFLAAHQGKKIDLYTEEEPGKILHEFRVGELANCKEIPFAPYYGSVDATPLFLITFEAYLRWTNDLALLEQLWPNIDAAVHWMKDYGDKDQDMFLEYCSTSERGLVNQGWKDSTSDVISHRDGSIAQPPIALCEVQAYAYAAYRAMSYLARRLNRISEAGYWEQTAERLRTEFLSRFWWEDEHVFYLALDRNKQPCAVVTSNAGQCLWSGIVPDQQAKELIVRLMAEDMYSGWGIRTLSDQAARYNPISYHNGSVWPHDTAIVGTGFAQYGRKDLTDSLLKNLAQASRYFERARLHELFCGFTRSDKYGPSPFPTACEPQAWSAGAPFILLSALLGFEPDAEHHSLMLRGCVLPGWLQRMELQGMRLGEQHVALHLERSNNGTTVDLLEKTNGDLHIYTT